MFTAGASDMALLHNIVLAGFNSIYIQSSNVNDEDIRDFVRYSLAWCRFTIAHHDAEVRRLDELESAS